MIFKRLKKKEKQRLEFIQEKEKFITSLGKSVQFLENQYQNLNNLNLSVEEYYTEKKFLEDKISVCKKQLEHCKKELDVLKSEGRKS